jgi:hypothetical protein
MKKHSEKISAIFQFGICEINQQWPDYVGQLSLIEEDILELIEIVENSNLAMVSTGCSIEDCAPMHAWRALGQIGALGAVKPLFQALINQKNDEAFWYAIELPEVIRLIGLHSINIITSFLNENSDIEWNYQLIVVQSLVNVALANPESREHVISIITHFLEDYKTNYSSHNACLIKELSRLEAKKVSTLVRNIISEDEIDFEFVTDEEVRKIIE